MERTYAENCFLDAVKSNDINVVIDLIEKKVNVSSGNNLPIIWAVYSCNYDIADVILDAETFNPKRSSVSLEYCFSTININKNNKKKINIEREIELFNKLIKNKEVYKKINTNSIINANKNKKNHIVDLLWNVKSVKNELKYLDPILYSELIKKEVKNKLSNFFDI